MRTPSLRRTASPPHRALLAAGALTLALLGCGAAPQEAAPEDVSPAPVALATSSLASCEGEVAGYVSSTVSTANIFSLPGAGNAHRTLQIDAITAAAAGQPGLVDPVLTLTTTDPDVRFVGPANFPNYVFYYHQEAGAWAALSPDESSDTPAVQLRAYGPQGALTPPVPRSNGATFRVGVRFLSGVPHRFSLRADIAYRPNWLKTGAARTHSFLP